MGNLNYRRAFIVQAFEHVHDLLALRRVEISSRLISQDDSIIDPLTALLEKYREYRTFRQMDDSEHGGEDMDKRVQGFKMHPTQYIFGNQLGITA